ncbi:MAG TPA: DUF4352 domain-containing protein [Ktedonobacteraceae bacterium]|jgi:hypothetical protein|nr:DUF4352 domain-containing protein [Ktedonobacteraceae bacterium]
MASGSNETPKWVIYVGGIASIATIIGVIITYFSYVHPNTNNNPGSTVTPSSGITSTPVSTTPAPDPIWNVILNRTYDTLTYNNYTVSDTQGHHFLIIDASFANISSAPQSLSGNLFDLQDGSGQHYTEDQASDPGQSFAVNPGQSIETQTAFVVPDSFCTFELSFIAASSVVAQWTINSSMCS